MNPEKLGVKLKKLREAKGFTQEEVATQLHLSRQSISKWENGKGFPDIDNLIRLSELYNISLDELVESSSRTNINNISDESLAIRSSLIIEILLLIVALILSCHVPVIGFIIPLAIIIWLKITHRKYILVYIISIICLVICLRNFYVLLNHFIFNAGYSEIQKL